ncbi:HMT1-like vacuolar membrane protein [Fusarium globosum]|uniref:HMT1-like vacuolar membrane protein n=1 Tax=Fusarium globosum TaxID=78864 RepID=A0A8H5YMR9_9HYPO|nr:HMT1-like vacuolar membrane protein [Fusarium globosum]
MAANSPAKTALVILYYLYPALVFIYFFFASLVSACTVHSSGKDERKKKCPSRRLTLVFCLLCILTYTTQLLLLGAQAVLSQSWPTEDHIIIGHLACILAFGIQLSRCLDTDEGPFYPFIGSWLLGLSFDIAITVLSAILGLFSPFDVFSILASVSISIRCLSFISLASLFAVGFPAKSKYDEEQEPLLPKVTTTSPDSPTSQESGYGSTLQAEEEEEDEALEYSWERREREAKEAMKKRLEEGGNWFEYAKGFKILFPYVWPVGNVGLQLRAAAVCLCLFASNALHLLIPRQTGIIMDSLNGSGNSNPWISVLVFAALRLAASESGIELVRQWLWVPVKYYSHDTLTRAAYSHMMHLSADFHDSKSSSDMMMAIYGGSAVSNVIENVLLYAVPMLIDMGVAIVYLSITFGPYEGLITVATGVFFLLIASRLVANSKAASRNRVNALYEEHYVRQSGFLGWQTVSAFNQIGYEDNRHANAVTNRWLREQQYVLGWYISIGFQTLVLTSGLLASAFLAVYRIRAGHATPGQFAMLLMYWAQLTSPLQFFAKLGKNVSDDFIDAERLLDIMRTQPSVENQKGARPLKFVAGEVEFERVSFSYDKKKGIIKDVSFHVPAGQTVAFVGATGAGKSTLIKLLDRFYDVGDGRICIDGQDIRDVDLFSLRDRIGVVPQNPILFDDTIMNNVRYGRITATDEEVFEACHAACIHDKIKGFTHGYKTRVGERGVKLSGGELQRIAIARAMLKKPDIVLLDEATSAVDTDTEQQIQISFKRLCQGRTTFIVAHRLSTIMNADRIIVVENGEILEQGNHDELIVAGGRYADLWSKQVFVRTKEEDADASTGQAGFVNDLSSEQTRTELSKVNKPTTATNEQPKSSEARASAEDALVTQGRKQEGTRLNPVAATFTPRRLAKIRKSMETGTSEASTSSITQDGLINEGRPITSSGDTTTQTTDSREKKRAFMAAVDRALKSKQAKEFDEAKVSEPLVKCGDEAEGVTKEGDVAESQTFEYKLPYYSRRAQSKSEPSQASRGSDGADVDNELPLSSTGKQVSPHRRVTLPPMKASAGSQIPVATEHNQAVSSVSRTAKVRDSTIDRCFNKQSAQQIVEPTMPGRSATLPSSNDKDPQGEDGVTTGTNTTDGLKHGNNEISEPRENPISSTPRRGGRGGRDGRRGRSPWYRGRRGRGGYRGSPQGRQAA